MKILYIHNNNLNSEKANLIQVKAMCNALGKIGNEVILSLPSDRNKRNASMDYTYNNYKIQFRKCSIKRSKIDKYINWKSIKEAVKANDPELCYVRNPLILKQTMRTGKKIIIELHNNKLHQRFLFDKYWKNFLIKKAKTEQISKVVCISKALSDYWISKGVPSEKVITAHDGFDPNVFTPHISQNQARKKLNFPANKNIISYLGRLYKNRKIHNILTLAQEYPESLFVIVGGPNDQSEHYKKLANQLSLKNVIITGQIPHDQITDYLFASDVLLALWSKDVKTINYCSPLKVFEYMAAGRIIVAHGFNTIKEVLHHGKNSYIVEPESIEDLIIKTGKAITEPYPSDIAKQARYDVYANYTWEQRAAKILSGIARFE